MTETIRFLSLLTERVKAAAEREFESMCEGPDTPGLTPELKGALKEAYVAGYLRGSAMKATDIIGALPDLS